MRNLLESVRASAVYALLTATIVVVIFVGLAIVWPEDAQELQTAHNTEVTVAGVQGIACMLELPPAGTPGGRTDEDVDRCLERFRQLLEE